MESQIAEEDSVIILVDRSGSMRTREADGRARLDVAKEEAKRAGPLVQSQRQFMAAVLRRFRRTRIMVIAFAERASVVCPFTVNVDEVVSLIDGIQPTDGRTNIKERSTWRRRI